MTFGEFCREYYIQENGIEIPDWQVEVFDHYYDEYINRGPKVIVNIPRCSGKTQIDFTLKSLLCTYLEEEENGKQRSQDSV